MKHRDSENKLKIDPSIRPFHKKKLFSSLNYVEVGAIILVLAGIILLLAMNSFSGKAGKNKNSDSFLNAEEQKNILDNLRKENPPISFEGEQRQIEILDSLSKKTPIISPEEEQEQIKFLDSLRKQF